jgi:hypothetical protein
MHVNGVDNGSPHGCSARPRRMSASTAFPAQCVDHGVRERQVDLAQGGEWVLREYVIYSAEE